MPLPQPVSALVTERLATVDAALPGFVTALWVTGSAASDDWRPDRSDVDFVAATIRVPALTDAEALAALHAARGEPPYDGIYVAESDLAAPPSAEEPAAHVTNSEFGTGPCGPSGSRSTPTWPSGACAGGPASPEFTMADGLRAAALVRAVVTDAETPAARTAPGG